jgi:hypothetical protein
MIRQTSLRPTLKSYRLALVVIACVSVAALLVSRGSKAASPASGTLTTANTPTNPLTFTGGPYAIGNPSNFVNLVCSPPVAPCDDYALTVDLPDGLQDTKQVRVVVSWADTNADIDLAIYQRNADGTVGAEVTRAGTSSDPEIALLPAVKGSYVVRVIPFAPLNQTVTTAITVEPKASRFTQGAGTAPGYRNYAAPGGLGTDSGEPSLGVNWNTGNVMFIAKLQTLRITFDNIGGAAWKDVSGLTTSLATTDAILWTDSTTGRTIASQLTGTNSLSAFTDNDGDSWTPTEGGPLTSGVDHQTVGGGPYAPPLRGGTALYPHAVYYCSQDLVTAFCARSDDGGLTFGPTIPMFLQTCGGIHGHVKVAPDGTVYVPNRSCGSNQGVLVSEDNGITWDVRTVADADPTTSTYDSITDHWDPSVGVGSNGALYFGYDNGDGTAHIAVSHDRGRSWATDQNVGLPYGIKDTAFPAVVAGDDDRAAFAFLGSQAPSGSDAAVWHLYIATTYDSGNSWTTVDATPTDPVQRGTICFDGFGVGACPKGDRNLLDFMDATVDKLGRVLVGYADGCVGCSSAGGSRAKLATIARQTCGRRLFSQYDSTAEDCGAATPTPTPTATPTPTPTPTPGNDPRCNPPGVKLFDDPADDQFGGPNANQQADIRAVSMAEQYTSGGQVLVFTMKLSQINPLVQPPNTFWQINFNATHADGTTTTYFVNAATNTNSNPAGIAYRYGFLDAAASTGATQLSVGAADSGAIDGNAGTITITLNTNKLKKPVPPASGQTNSTLTGPQVDLSAGKQLVAIVAETSQLIGAAGTGAGLTLDDTASAEYTMAGAAACPAATPTPTPGGGNTGAVVLHFHGNTDDGTCTGQGTADVQACGGPFLKTSATLATTPAAHWDTGPNLLDGTSAHNIYDPNWLWNSGAVRLGGDMTVEWWASCSACGAGVGNADWIIRLFADNQKVFEKTVRATPTTPNVPQLLSAKLFLPETNVGTSVVLQIETTFVDSQSMTHFFYDSQSACPGVVGGPACDSRVTMPVLAPGQVAPTPTPTPTPTPGITPTPTPANPALAPRYTNYTTPSGVAESAGEPSVGVNWKSERSFSNSAGSVANGGTVTYFGGFLPYMLRATFDDSVSPASVMWDQAPLTIANAPRVFGDPILFTDHQTGRTFVSQEFGLTPLGSTMEWTDDDGRSFKPSMGSGAPSGVDHQTVGGGPYHTPLNITTNPVYPNSVYYCSQALEYAVCALSVDGGTTFGPSVPMYTFRDCGGIHGHVKVAPDGTVYVPNRSCNGEQGVALSEDNGITWKVRHVTGSTPGDTDPSIGIASDGTLYFGYETTDFHARIAVSHDKGQTWTNDTDAGAQLGINSIVFPEVVAGDPDRAAFAYLGSTTAGNYNDDAYTGVFYLIIASTFDGGKTWTTINATPNDPVQRGRVCTDGINCTGTSRNLLDFFDFSVDKEGRGVVGYVDGCTGSCVQSGPNTGSAKAVVARQSGGKRLFAQFDPPAASAPGAPAVAGSLSGTTVSLSWSTPDNGGAAITNYKVYRRDGTTVTPLATVTNNSFSDPGYNATTQTVYRVTALNANGESAYKEFNPAGGGTGGQSACAQPGVLVVSDVNSDGADLDGNQNTPPDARVNIKGLYVAEPYMGAGINKLVFTLKVAPSTLGAAPPSSQWYIIWNRPVPDANFDRWYVAMKTDATGTPTFEYGKFGVATNTSTSQIPPPQSTSTNQSVKIGDADGGSYDPVTGTITITLSTSKAENVTAGRTLGGMNARTFFARPDAGLRAQSVASDITGDGSYKMVGNGSCSSASLVAPQNNNTPSSGAQVAWVSAPYALTRWATGLIF